MRRPKRLKVTIIIPVYNEQTTIEILLRRVSNARLPYFFTREVVVVDDGSTDQTRPKILKLDLKIKLITHTTNRGKGAAIRSGLKVATGDIVLIQDADLEYNPADYYRLVSPFFDHATEAVYGSRLINYPLILSGPRKTPMPLHLLANKFLTLLTGLLYGHTVTDMETCYKVINRKLLDSLKIRSNRFDFEPEVTAKLLKRHVNIREIPITVSPRTYSQGKKISWLDGIIAVWTLFKFRFTD